MKIINYISSLPFSDAFLACSECSVPDDNKQPNVLFIAIDDLRSKLGCYGNSHIKSGKKVSGGFCSEKGAEIFALL